jgi:hypothetical protein
MLDSSQASAPVSAPDKFKADCVPDPNQSVEERLARLNILEARTAEVAEGAALHATMTSNAAAHDERIRLIMDAASAWAAEHDRVLKQLNRCSGARLKNCKSISVDNLLEVVDIIKAPAQQAGQGGSQ